jgi:hypothetical protein
MEGGVIEATGLNDVATQTAAIGKRSRGHGVPT